MAERENAEPNDDPGIPSGLPEGEEDSKPLGGVDEPDPEGEGDTPRGADAQPGIQRGEPDVSG